MVAARALIATVAFLGLAVAAPPGSDLHEPQNPFQDLAESEGLGGSDATEPSVPWPAVTDVTHPRCTGYICSIEMCLPIEDCDGEVRPNATECGCCPLCIQYLDEGRACGLHGVLRFPVQPTTMCRPPLRCIDGYCATPDASGAPVRGRPRKQKPLPSAVEALERVLFGFPR